MSLAIFSVKNAYHRNGKYFFIKVFGGLPKCLIELSANNDMTVSVFSAGSSPTSSITSDSNSYINALFKPLMLPTYLVFILKWTRVTGSGFTVTLD